jgi:hypothetical protein
MLSFTLWFHRAFRIVPLKSNMTYDDQTKKWTNRLIYKMQPSLVRTKDGTCTKAENTPYAFQ